MCAPQKSRLNFGGLNAAATSRMNSRIGTSFAIVVTTLMMAACRIPIRISAWSDPENDRGADDRLRGIPLGTEGRIEIAQGAEDQYDIGDVAEPGAEPVSPGTVEADKIAKPGPGIGIGTGVERRFSGRQALIDEGQRQHADAGDQPADDDGTRRCALGHVLRQAENAAANHRTHDEGNKRHQSEFAGCLDIGLRRRFETLGSHAFPLPNRDCVSAWVATPPQVTIAEELDRVCRILPLFNDA